MSSPRELHCYDYVPASYLAVRAALESDAAGIVRRATTSAAARAGELAATLRFEAGPIEVGVDVNVTIGEVTEESSPLGERKLCMKIAWTAARASRLFPTMDGTLVVFPLGGHETQLDLHAVYHPPFGPLGNALDALVGGQIAQASLRRFVEDVSRRLTAEIA